MIELCAFSKRYGRIEAVAPLDLTARPGEVLALLGPNGAGKTTTIRAIVGLTRPSAGAVRVAGFDVWREPLRAKASLGYVPDRPYLYGKLTGRELLRFKAGLHRMPRPEPEIERWLEFFSLASHGNKLIETYSHGMKQKLTLVAALLPEPPVLVVDEPMVGLDPKAARQTRDLLAQYAARGRTVLLTTHSLPVAEAVAHRIAVLDKGRLLALGTLAELQRRAGAEEAGEGGLEQVFFRLVEDEDGRVAQAAD